MTRAGTVAILNRGTISDPTVGWLRAQPWAYEVVRPLGDEIAAQRNAAVRAMVGDWLCFVDADCVPPVDVIPRLLSHGVGVVGGVILAREGAHEVCAVKTFEPTVRYALDEVMPARGLMPVLSLGTGCLLIRRAVLDAVGPPWFRCGQLVVDALTEDTDWCLRAAERGFPAYLDCTVRVGHVLRGLLWSSMEPGALAVQWEGAPYGEILEDRRLRRATPLYGNQPRLADHLAVGVPA